MTGPKEMAGATGGSPPGQEAHLGLVDTQRDGTATDLVAQADKRFATARARLAIGGYALHILDGGTEGALYLVQRWDRSRTLADMDAVEAFIKQALGTIK